MSSNVKPSFIIRKYELKDCEEYINIRTELGYSSAKYIIEVMFKVDSDSTFVAQDKQTGKIIGICGGYNHSSNFAFIGNYMVRPQYQGLGIGSAIWAKVMEHIGTERNISLFPSEKIFLNRDKWGFSFVPEKRLQIYEGKANCEHLVKKIKGISMTHINKENLQSVIEYDKQVCDGFDRSVFLEEFSKIPETICLVAIHEETDRVIGYCITTTTNTNTASVEPLYADNKEIAELLIGKCCQLLPISITNGLKFKCWDSNERAIDMVNKIGLSLLYELPILFKKQVIEGNLEKIYCLSSIASHPF